MVVVEGESKRSLLIVNFVINIKVDRLLVDLLSITCIATQNLPYALPPSPILRQRSVGFELFLHPCKPPVAKKIRALRVGVLLVDFGDFGVEIFTICFSSGNEGEGHTKHPGPSYTQFLSLIRSWID